MNGKLLLTGLPALLALSLALPAGAGPAASPGDLPAVASRGQRRATPALDGVDPFRHVVRSLARFRGATWIGTYGDGLYRLSDDGAVERFRAGESPLVEDRVNCLAVHQDQLWIGTCAGIQLHDGEDFGAVHRAGEGSVAHDIYHVVKPLPVGGVWVGTTGKGLSVHRDGSWRTYAAAEGLVEPWVNDVAAGAEGGVFVATNAGLFRGEPGGRFGIYQARGGKELPFEVEVTALARLCRNLWVGTTRGLWQLQHGYWIAIPAWELPSPHVLALAVDREDRLWIGTRAGLASFHPREGFRKHSLRQVPPREEVKVLDVDVRGVLRAGTLSGRVYERGPGSDDFRLIFDRGPLGD